MFVLHRFKKEYVCGKAAKILLHAFFIKINSIITMKKIEIEIPEGKEVQWVDDTSWSCHPMCHMVILT